MTFKINRTYPGPFIAVEREYGNEVGIIEIRLYRSHLIYSPRIRQGVTVQEANDAEILGYVERLLANAFQE